MAWAQLSTDRPACEQVAQPGALPAGPPQVRLGPLRAGPPLSSSSMQAIRTVPPQPSPLAGLAPAAKAKAQPLAGFTVLLCENDRSVRDLLGGLLRAEGANVSLANRVAEGRAQLAAHRFDLLVLDRGLADGDGLALVPDAKGARILIVTGVRETGDGTADRAADAGYPVLVKPFRIDAFRRAIVQALNG
jgi:CheY-like chemotaxis protein